MDRRSRSRRVLRTPYRDRNRPAKRRYGMTIPSAVWQALRNGTSRFAWWQPSLIRPGTVTAARLPQRRTAGGHGHGRKPQAAKPSGLRSVALPPASYHAKIIQHQCKLPRQLSAAPSLAHSHPDATRAG